MALIVYLDETGDHSLELIDEQFPIFGVVMFVCDTDYYIDTLVPTVTRLKFKYFNHEGAILHSRDIRRAQGDFRFLRDKDIRHQFYEDINAIMGESQYELIGAFIKKQLHKERYGMAALHPYDLAMKFAMERLQRLLRDAGQTEVLVVAESRGKKEDNELELSFRRIADTGTEYIRSDLFQQIDFQLEFRQKEKNLVGTQLADLVAYPIARHLIDKDKENPAFDIVKPKFYRGPGNIHGFKVFP